MKVVIGLGNPTQKHTADRHNSGFHVLDMLAGEKNIFFEEKSAFYCLLASSKDMLFAKPTTWMNDSGLCAKALFKQYGVLPVVIYDDIDITLGEVKCSFGRGAGGHNGVQSIIDHLGTKDFFRIRVGVRPVHDELKDAILPPKGFETFLLKPFAPFEKELREQGAKRAVAVLSALETKSFDEVMNEFN